MKGWGLVYTYIHVLVGANLVMERRKNIGLRRDERDEE